MQSIARVPCMLHALPPNTRDFLIGGCSLLAAPSQRNLQQELPKLPKLTSWQHSRRGLMFSLTACRRVYHAGAAARYEPRDHGTRLACLTATMGLQMALALFLHERCDRTYRVSREWLCYASHAVMAVGCEIASLHHGNAQTVL